VERQRTETSWAASTFQLYPGFRFALWSPKPKRLFLQHLRMGVGRNFFWICLWKVSRWHDTAVL